MKIFVPKYRQDLPQKNLQILTHMMVEVDEKDLRNHVIDFWKELDGKAEFLDVEEFFNENIKRVCDHAPLKDTLEPFLRRPHFVIHAGSAPGAEHCSEVVSKIAYDAGRLVARNGFNLWYGGGNSGLMGCGIQGFTDELEENGSLPDQYSVQVIPADFVIGVKSANGLRPKNEGLCTITDAAIVMPDFITRRELLDSRCTAAITCPGGIGSLDEWSDMAVKIKTGLSNVKLYTLNPYIEKLGCRYYDPLWKTVESFVACGLQDRSIFDYVHLKETPEQVFEDLMPQLESKNAAPNQVYDAYCRMNKASPGIPTKMIAYPSDKKCLPA